MRLSSSDTLSNANKDCPDPDELLKLADNILQKAGEEKYGVQDMLMDAVTLEGDFRKVHATYALTFKDPSLLSMFKCLAQDDAEHINEINTYIKDYNGRHRSGKS